MTSVTHGRLACFFFNPVLLYAINAPIDVVERNVGCLISTLNMIFGVTCYWELRTPIYFLLLKMLMFYDVQRTNLTFVFLSCVCFVVICGCSYECYWYSVGYG